jgi:DNA-directed RNA polymerase subunit RPC12/RpoP
MARCRTPESRRRNFIFEDDMEQSESAGQGILVQVCIECGKEYFQDDGAPAPDRKCEKCGNTVFRSFYASAQPDDAATDFADSTDRDTLTDDGATDVTRGDLHDLNNL